MTTLYVLEATMEKDSCETCFCVLGTYSTRDKAEQAVEIAKDLGWCDFVITPYGLDVNPS